MKKTATIILLLITMIFTSLFFASCKNYPLFINPTDISAGNQGANKYDITIKSAGGLKLNNVKVSAYKDGALIKTGVSLDGKVELVMPLDEYDLVFSDLPKGYFLDENVSYKTSATDTKVSVQFNSAVINTTAQAGTVYNVGDVMYDFSVQDVDGNQYVLSDLLTTYKAVMLNFWYKDCQPCRSEFPAMDKAYQSYTSDIKALALTAQDTVSQIKEFEEGLGGLTVALCQDFANLTSYFSVQSFPTTIIIDRFGVVAFRESGSIPQESVWKNMFEKYISEDYVQDDIIIDGSETEDDKRVYPTYTMGPSLEIEQAINGEGFTFDYYPENNDEFSWPWKVENDYLVPTNLGVGNSYAIIYTNVTLGAGQVLTFKYDINTEAGNDVLYVTIDRELVAEYSGKTDGWNSAELYVADRYCTIELAFTYLKDQALDEDNEYVKIDDLSITELSQDGTARDYGRPCAYNSTGVKYLDYIETELGDDGYYHNKETGAIIFADIMNVVPWSKIRFEGNVCRDNKNNVEYYYSMYDLSFWQLPEVPSDSSFIFNGKNYNKVIYESHRMQMLSDNKLLPVDETMKNMLQDFAETWARKFENNGLNIHDNMWLEFCYYYDHYGDEHLSTEFCNVNHDPVKGMIFRNAYNVEVDTITPADNKFPLQSYRGVKFIFTAPTSGAYKIVSLSNDVNVDPYIFLFDNDVDDILEVDDDFNGYITQDDVYDYDRFSNPSYKKNFQVYLYLEEGEKAYFSCALQSPGDVGFYNIKVEYLGESANILLHCTEGEGLFASADEAGKEEYIAVPVALNPLDRLYYAVQNNDYG